MKWSDPSLVNLNTNAQGLTPCDVGSGYVAPPPGCNPGAADGVDSCSPFGFEAVGACAEGAVPNLG
jgi:hypothetical protein